MKLILSPIAYPTDDTPPTITGDVITYRGQSYDFSPLPEGGEIEVGSPFVGAVTRVSGAIHATLEYRYNWDTSDDFQSTDWDDYTFTVVSGVCPCPIKRKPEWEVVIERLLRKGRELLLLKGYNETQISAMTGSEFIAALEKEGISAEQLKELSSNGSFEA